MRTVQRTMGILMGNTETQAKMFLVLLRHCLHILHLVHPFTGTAARRTLSRSGMKGLLTFAGLDAPRKAASPIAALYFEIYSGEASVCSWISKPPRPIRPCVISAERRLRTHLWLLWTTPRLPGLYGLGA